jgi:CubicO group peptidase (beta-lactamase class C family)
MDDGGDPWLRSAGTVVAMDSVRVIEDWPVEQAATAVVDAGGAVLGAHGPQDRVFELASVTKLLTAYAVLIAVEEGALDWDDPAGPEGATVRHLAAHTAGVAFEGDRIQAKPGLRRIYSNRGFELLGDAVATAAGMPFADYLQEAVLEPLGMTASRLDGSPAAGMTSTCADLTRFAAELQAPTLVSAATLREATSVVFPGVAGVLPGYGRQAPNDWGLGFEIRDGKSPHWTGARSSPRTFGHFGQSGTFLWVDPDAGAACVVLTDRDFGPWAIEAWPPFTDRVLAAL